MSLATTLLVLVAQFLAFSSAQSFQAVTIETKLPEKLSHVRSVFDGLDSMLGGYNGSADDYIYPIWKFSITEETLEEVGRLPLVGAGSAVWLGDETIAYISGIFNYSEIRSTFWKASTTDLSSWSEIGNVPVGTAYPTSVWDHQDTVYTIGGYSPAGISNVVSKYDVVKQTSEEIAEVPNQLFMASSVWDTEHVAYIFGGFPDRTAIYKFDPVDETVSLIDSLRARAWSCVIWTGEVAYAIDTDNSFDLLQFDPSTNERRWEYVNDFYALDNSGCTYVPYLNRMYIFGGYRDYDRSYSDSITYINLFYTPTTKPLTDTYRT